MPAVPTLGELEIAVLDRVWRHPGVSVKEMHELVGVDRAISQNTVQSTLDRLFRKGLLRRVKSGHAYRYTAILEREQLVAALIGDVVDRFGADPTSALAAFVDAADHADRNALEDLGRELERPRKQGSS